MMMAPSSPAKRLKSAVKGEGSSQGSSVDQDKQIPMVVDEEEGSSVDQDKQKEGSIKESHVYEDTREEEEEEEDEDEDEEEEEEEEEEEGTFQESDDEEWKSNFRECWDFDPKTIEFDDEFTESQKEEYRKYHEQMRLTEGFGIDYRPDFIFWGTETPYPLDLPSSRPETQKRLDDLACYAMNRYNKIKGESLRFKDVVKVTYYGCAGTMYFITFRAFDSQDELQTFETKVLRGINRRKSVYSFRLKKPAPQV